MIPLMGETMDRRRSVEDGILEVLVGRQSAVAVTHGISFSPVAYVSVTEASRPSLCGRSPRTTGAVGERLSAIQLEQDEAFDFAAQAKAPMASAGARPRAKARIRIQKLVEKFRRMR